MPRNHFYKINRAFIVNFNYISRYNSDEIIFSNGEHVHISRKVSHGMGLYAIENSAKRYSGDVKLSWKDDVFRLDISLDFNMASTKESA